MVSELARSAMDNHLLLEHRLVGALIVLGITLPLTGAGVVAGRGDLRGLTAAFRGIDGVGEAATALSTINRFAIPGVILQIAGVALLTLLLFRAGDPAVAPVAFVLLLFSLVLAAVEGSFHGSVTAWAGAQLAQTGEVPELFEPMRRWMNQWIQLVYLPMALIGAAGFGWAILETVLLPRWLGWFAVVWSLVSLVLLPMGAPPAVAFVPLLVIGGEILMIG